MTNASRHFIRRNAGALASVGAAILLMATAPAPSAVPNAAPPSPVTPPPTTTSPATATPATIAPVAALAPAPLPKELNIPIDQTRTLELDQPVATVSVGNPSIADVNMQSGHRLFLLGKSFGRTNIVALDAEGHQVLDMTVFVTSRGGGSVTVYKGNRQLTYNCSPNCDRTLMPGDSKEDFESLSGQMNQKTSFGIGAGGRE